jgi:hypothetical protein
VSGLDNVVFRFRIGAPFGEGLNRRHKIVALDARIENRFMDLTVGDLSRRALETLALEEYKSGHLTKPELRRLLGFETRYELDGFLKEHGVYEGFTLEEIEQQVGELKQLGF